MKLRSLQVRAFRKFSAGARLTHFNDGLNLICGPNESGKSTLVRAVRAAFFERHVSTSAIQLQPWGDTGAAPEVELEFDCGGNRWRLAKRFLKGKRCDLSCGGESYSGELAERKLAELLGFELPGKGASQPRHWGIPGLLWIEQGAGQEVASAVEYAGQTLKAALASAVGDLTGGEGDAIIRAAQAERARYLTAKTGQPTGEYAAALAALQSAEAEAQEAERQVEQQAALVDELGELRARLTHLMREQPWRELRQRARAAEAALAAAEEQATRAAALTSEVAELEARRGAVSAERQRWRARLAEAEARAGAVAEAGQRAERARAEVARAERQLQQRQSELQAARGASQAAERARLASALQSSRAGAQQTLARFDAQLQRAQQANAAVQAAQAALSGAPTEAQLNRVRQLQAALREAELELRLNATHLSFAFDPGVAAQLDGTPLPAAGERQLQARAELLIPGCGRLTIEPGGRDLAQVSARVEQRRAALGEALRALGVAELGELEQRAEAAARARADLAAAKAGLAAAAPAGLETLLAERAAAAHELQRIERELAALGSMDADSAAQAQDWLAVSAALKQAEARAEAAAAAHAQAREALAAAEQTVAVEREAQARSEAYLHSGAAAGEGARLDELEADLERRLAQGRAEAEQLARALAAANPQLLRQDLKRFEDSAAAQEQAVQHDQQRAAALAAQLELLGGRELGDALAHAQQLRASCRAHADELGARARAADLLLQVLEDQRRQVTERLHAPLKQHVRHYLSILWPGAEVELDATLAPAAVLRGGPGGGFGELSFGMREQLGLICRLAYADLLRTAGHPTLIILDDALVHADGERLAQMKRILFDASERHQILLFSCHPEKWRDLGVAPQMLAELAAAGD